jgi:thymidylate synthase
MKLPRNRSRWGTYFHRLIAYGGKKNQLELTIEKLKHWPRYTTALVFHLSCPLVDQPRTRGGPCWHYGELIWHKGDVLDLVVVYRNHDFFNKALGNFIALGQLLAFIAKESGKTTGRLVCHSVHAYSANPMSKLTALAKI